MLCVSPDSSSAPRPRGIRASCIPSGRSLRPWPPWLAYAFLATSTLAGDAMAWKACLNQPPAWYATVEAQRVADTVLLYQRHSGGWPKNTDFAVPLTAAQPAKIAADKSRNDATIDNGATCRELRFLARVHAAQPAEPLRHAALTGLDYLLDAQYPNGGWPQSFPHPRGYSAHITFNDGAMVNVLELLADVASESDAFAFVDDTRRQRARDAVARGLDCILRCQVVHQGRRTVWCAQHDARTLAPAPARTYELASLSGSESVGIVRFLMRQPQPNPQIIDAVHAAVAWLRQNRLTGIRVVERPDPSLPKGFDKVVVSDPLAPPLWARFYDLTTFKPLFCGRDGVVRERLADIEAERRTGYAWYTDAPAALLNREYPPWQTRVNPTAAHRPRVLVLTDISNEPDDEESMVRFLVYANEFEIEGLIATTSTWLRHTTRVDLIHRQLDAYDQVRSNLLLHAPGFPPTEALRAVTAIGQPAYGMAAVGQGQSTAGSRRLLAAADRADHRPLWISVWGGANTLAQALFDARHERSPADLDTLVARLRVYTISDQDDAGPWLRREFPGLFYIVSPSTPDWKEYWRATWTGISGDRHYRNGPGHAFALVDNPWLEANVIRHHGPLGALYPRLEYIMEGDTPSFLGLINHGLGWEVSPAYGGWGGRYALYQPYGESRPVWTNHHDSRDTVTADNGQTECTDMATVWRWRQHFQQDFAARMDWCVTGDYAQANHNPVAVINADTSKRVLEITARGSETVQLSAEGTHDPDRQLWEARWWIYPEASSLRDAKGRFPSSVTLSHPQGTTTQLTLPAVTKPETLHVILQIQDQGTPSLFAYRRAILTVQP